MHSRQQIPIISAGVLQGPVPIPPVASNAIDEAFAATRETIAQLEAERDARELVEPMTDITWSPAQHCRRAA